MSHSMSNRTKKTTVSAICLRILEDTIYYQQKGHFETLFKSIEFFFTMHQILSRVIELR